ncbi:MAG: murein biosynthesis integral membrane protein MurJ [Caldilineae bacterium]|nr:murein biosynthesis integral membrane protein MurJ [Caldilineae bacterium]
MNGLGEGPDSAKSVTPLEPEPSPPDRSGDGGAARLIGAASLLSLGSVASRLLGLVRIQVIGFYFGAGFEADAFTAAQRVPTMIYDQLVGGQISAAIVPVLTHYAEARRDELWRAASVLVTAAATASGLAGLLLYLLAGPVARLLVGAENAGLPIVETSLKIMAPGILLFGLAGMFTGLLYALQRFSMPALAAPIYNLAMIGAFLAARPMLGVYALPLGVTIGGLAQVLVLARGLSEARLRPRLDLRHPALRRVLVLYAPVAAGLLVTQGQIVAATRFAAMGAEGTQASLGYADRLIQFPQGFIATAISIAILPALAAAFARDERGTFARTLARGLRMVLSLVLPAAIGMAALAEPVVGLLLQHGAFGTGDRLAVSLALYGYLIGLPFAALDLSLNNAFYSRQNTVLPALVGVLSVGVYLIAALLLGPTFHLLGGGFASVLLGLALADTFKHMAHAAAMAWLVRRRIDPEALRGLGRTLLAAGLAAGSMGLVVWGFDQWLASEVLLGAGKLAWSLRLALGAGLGLAIYLPLAARLGVAELAWSLGILRQRLARGGG